MAMLSGVTDKNGTISYNYDVMNGLTSVTLYDGKTIDYTYDEAWQTYICGNSVRGDAV